MTRMPPLVREVGRALRRPGAGAGGVVAAVSGGPDSVALWRSLAALGAGHDTPLVVAHLNHRLRGADSDADEAFVREQYALLSAEAPLMRLRCEGLDVGPLARAGRENVEAAGRRLRYDWLAQVARAEGLGRVATGHTADDQAETVLHRLLRGAGLRGLRGIAARRPLAPDVVLLRPLLHVRRADVMGYLDGLGQPYRLDRSNLDVSLTRNRLRLELLPHLRAHYNPEVASVLCRLAAQAEEVYATEEAEARALLTAAERPRAGPLLVFDRTVLAASPRHRAREALRLAWEREGWPAGAMGHADWERLVTVALGEARAADLPGGVRARARGAAVQVGRLATS